MIVRELYKIRNDGIKLYRTYSSEGYKILQVETGIIYDEAVDIETVNYTYEETEEQMNELYVEEVIENEN